MVVFPKKHQNHKWAPKNAITKGKVKLPHRQNRKANNENLKLPYSLLSPLMTPVLSRMDNLSVADEKTLLRARFFFCHPDTGTRDYCELDVPHTVEHALTQCAYPPLENRRSMTALL